MKKIILIAMALGLLTACGGTETVYVPIQMTMPPTTAPATTAPPTTERYVPPTTESRADMEDLYISAVRAKTTELWSISDNDLLELGYMTCSHFQRGGTNDDLINTIIVAGIDNGVSEQTMVDMAGATGVAVAILCPEYAWKLG